MASQQHSIPSSMSDGSETAKGDIFDWGWNKPGRFVRGPLHKATTANLVFMVVGLVVIFSALAFSSTSTETVEEGTTLQCGSILSPAPKQQEEDDFLAKILGYTNSNTSSHRREDACINALRNKRGEAIPIGVFGFILFGIALLIMLMRNPKSTPWGDISRNNSDLKSQSLAGGGQVAGWYPDQSDPHVVRWFDGKSWTSATLPMGDG